MDNDKAYQVRKHKHLIFNLILAAMLLLMVSCGGGSGSGPAASDDPGTGDDIVADPGPVTSGRALLGVLAGAAVAVYDYSDLTTPIHTTTTSADDDISLAGRFDIPESLIDNDGLYMIAISGGDDLDANNDGVADASPTGNAGTLHLVISGSRLKAGDFQANILTEIIYRKVRYLMLADYPAETIETVMGRYVCALLKADVDGDRDMDLDDIMAFDPVTDRDLSSRSWGELNDFIWAARNNEPLGEAMDTIRENMISMLETDEMPMDLEIRGNYAYLLDSKGFSDTGTSTFKTVDYSDPSQPRVVGEEDLPGNARALTLSGDYAYVADGYNGLSIVSLSSPAYPWLRGNVTFDGCTRDVAVSGDRAYVTNYINGAFDNDLVVVNIGTPSSPSVTTTLDLPGTVGRIALYGNTAYITSSQGLHIVDITDSSAPSLVDTYDSSINDICFPQVWGSYLIAVDCDYYTGDAVLRIYDISTPTNPGQIGHLSFSATFIQDLFISGDTAYVLTEASGITAFDISDLSHPRLDYKMAVPGGYLEDLFVSGTTAWVSEGRMGLFTMDLSHPDDETVYSSLAVTTGSNLVEARGNYAYVDDGFVGLNIVNVMDPDFPSTVGTIPHVYVYDFALTGDYAVLADAYSDVQIWDISDPRAPTRESAIDTERRCLAVYGDYLLVGYNTFTPTFGLRVFNMIDPENPVLVGDVDIPGLPEAITVYSHYALVAVGDGGVLVIDMEDPETPEIVATIPTSFSASHVAVSGTTAWIAEDERVVGVSIADPASPAILGRIPVSGSALRLAVENNRLYVASGDAGIQVIDISDPDDIHIDCCVSTSHEALDVALANGYMFVADDRAGLSIFKAIQ